MQEKEKLSMTVRRRDVWESYCDASPEVERYTGIGVGSFALVVSSVRGYEKSECEKLE